MTAEMILRIVLIVTGASELLAALLALTRKKMTDTLCMIWGAFGLLSVAAGIFLCPSKWNRDLSTRATAQIVLIYVCLLCITFVFSIRVSSLLRDKARSAKEEALLRFENENAAEWLREHKELLVIIPAYNEEKSLPELLLGLRETGVGDIADLLVLNDGSTDRTQQLVREMGYRCVNGAHLGYGRTLQIGFLYASRAGYRFVIQMDADGQHDPRNIQVLYRALREPGANGKTPDIVLGSRFLPGGKTFPMPGAKVLAIRLFRLLLQLATGRKITDPTTGLQGLNARAVAYYAGERNYDDRYPDANMILQMLLRGYQILEIPALMHERTAGQGMYFGLKPFAYMLHMAASMPAVYIREALLRRRRDEAGDL